jgi:dihydrofolate reductase
VSATVLYMSISLDGFIAGPNEGPDNGLGDGGERLHEWAIPGGGGVDDLDAIRRSGGVNGRVVDEFTTTGAVVAGRGTFEPAGGWGGDHHDGVPIFILTRRDPADSRPWPLVTYVDDVTTAMTRAKEAAGDKNVLVHGAGTAQLALAAGVLDEIELHVVPVLFGQGRRLFEGVAPEQIEWSAPGSSRGRTVSPTCITGSSAEMAGVRGENEPAATTKAISDANLYMVLGTADEDGRPWGVPRDRPTRRRRPALIYSWTLDADERSLHGVAARLFVPAADGGVRDRNEGERAGSRARRPCSRQNDRGGAPRDRRVARAGQSGDPEAAAGR